MRTTLLSLQYPNGRVHECSLDRLDLAPGHEFELYGRRWRVDRVLPAGEPALSPVSVGTKACSASASAHDKTR